MRKLLWILSGLVLLVVGVVVALLFFVDVNRYRPQIQTELQKATGRTVSLGKMDLQIFPLRFRVENAVIADDAAFPGGRPFVEVGELRVAAALWPLLNGDVEVSTVELRQPHIELIRNADGDWNFASLGKPVANQGPTSPAAPAPAPAPSGPVPAPTTPAGPRPFQLEALLVEDGQVAVTDLKSGTPRAVYDHIELVLKNISATSAMDINAAVHLPGSGKQELRLVGTGGPLAADPIATPFDGALELNQASLSGLQKFLNGGALAGYEFTATGRTDLKNSNDGFHAAGQLDLADPMVKGIKLGFPVAAKFDMNGDIATREFKISQGELRLGPTPVTVSGVINTAGAETRLDLRLSTGEATIAELARLAGAFGVAFNPGMQVVGKLNANLSARGVASHPELNGQIHAYDLEITGAGTPQPVHIKDIQVDLSPDALRAGEFTATTGSTTVRARGSLSQYTDASPIVDVRLAAPAAQLGELLAIARAIGLGFAEGMDGSGPASLNLAIQGPVKQPALLQMSGKGELAGTTLKLAAFTKPIQVRSGTLVFSRNSMSLTNAQGAIGATNASGQLTLRNFAAGQLPEVAFSLSADRFDVMEFRSLLATPPVPAASAMRFQIIPQVFAAAPPTESLPMRLTGKGDLSVGTVLYDQLQMTNARATAVFDHGIVRLQPFTAQVAEGTQTGSIVVDLHPAVPTYTVQGKLANIDSNKFLTALSGMKDRLYGILGTNADVAFTAASSTDAAKSLNGRMDLNLNDGRLEGLSILEKLASIGKFVNAPNQPSFTKIQKLTGNFDIKNGVATTDNLNAAIDGGTVAAKGSIDLSAQTLNMQVVAVLSKDFSDSVGGNQIGGYLATALANNKGELVMPVLITGTLAAPKVSPDMKTIAKMKLDNLLPALGKDGNLTGSILDAVIGKKQPAQGQGQPGQPKKSGGQQVLQDILGALGGKSGQTQTTPKQPPPAQPNDGDIPDPSKPKSKTTQPAPKKEPPPEDAIPDPSKPKLFA